MDFVLRCISLIWLYGIFLSSFSPLFQHAAKLSPPQLPNTKKRKPKIASFFLSLVERHSKPVWLRQK